MDDAIFITAARPSTTNTEAGANGPPDPKPIICTSERLAELQRILERAVRRRRRAALQAKLKAELGRPQ